MFFFVFKVLLAFLMYIVPILLSVAFLTLVERKFLGSVQRRKGPNLVGWLGLMQPFADALKLVFKEIIFLGSSDKLIFLGSSLASLFFALLMWAVIPFGNGLVLVDLDLGILFIFAVSSLNVYSIIMAGWSSNSHYAFLGALRSVAQMISYEVSIALLLMPVFILSDSFNLSQIVLAQRHIWFVFPCLPSFFFFFISSLAETNRSPFDLPEAEAELVSGYNVEYSAVNFAFFFIAEYSNIILMSAISALMFFGGWLCPILDSGVYGPFIFSVKVVFFVVVFVWVRASLPRYRYDQLMSLGWKVFLPISLAYLYFIMCLGAVLVY